MINVVLETGPMLDSSFMVVTKPRRGKKKNTQRERATKSEDLKTKHTLMLGEITINHQIIVCAVGAVIFTLHSMQNPRHKMAAHMF